MDLTDLEFQVLLSALRYGAMSLGQEAVRRTTAGDKKNARAAAEYAMACTALAEKFAKHNPRATEQSAKLILPPGMKFN